jgi:hypothetical protein
LTITVTGRRERRRYRTEFIVRQLNELYAPARLLLAQDAVLSAQLKTGQVPNWHVLDNIDAIRSDAGKLPITQQIIEINRKIAAILETKSGLCVGPMPESFSRFLGHHYMLERAIDGLPFVANTQHEYFPSAFEQDINKGHDSLRVTLQKELKPWYRHAPR